MGKDIDKINDFFIKILVSKHVYAILCLIINITYNSSYYITYNITGVDTGIYRRH